MFRIWTPDSTGDVDPNRESGSGSRKAKIIPPPPLKKDKFLVFYVLDILSGESGSFSFSMKGFHEGLEYFFY
jgi:hypothetical protein